MAAAVHDGGARALSATVLCALDDIADPGAKGFDLGRRGRIFVVRADGRVFGYVNTCPHGGTPLDWRPDTFLAPDKEQIQCSTHGARFRIVDGLCLAGPCAGASLEAVAVRLEGGKLVLEG